MTEPMSDKRLAEIRVIAADERTPGTMAHAYTQHLTAAVRELLAEVERLRDVVAPLGQTDTEWSVLHISGRDEPLSEADARRFAKRAAVAGARLENRVVGEWREAD